MLKQEEMEQNMRHLMYQQEEMENSYKKQVLGQEDEDENLIYIRQGMNREYDNYGQGIRELSVLLEEQEELLNQFRYKKEELEEEIYYEHKRDCEKIEEELYELHTRIRCAEVKQQGGEKEDADK